MKKDKFKKSFLITFLILSLICSFTFFVFPIRATEIFSDGFESGDFTAWTSTVGTPTVDTEPVHHGTYSMLINAQESAYKSITSTADARYARAYVYFNTLPADAAYRLSFLVFDYVGYAIEFGFFAEIYNDGGTNKFSLFDGFVSVRNSTAAIYPSTGQWYYLELKVDSGGTGELWINGTSRIRLDCSAVNFETLYAGSCESHEGNENIDCVVISDAYIGEEITYFPYVQQISNVDSSSDIGTHSSFAAQQAAPDSTNDTLTEGNSGGSSSNTTMLNDGFETTGAGWEDNWDGNGATTWDQCTSATYGAPWGPHAGTYMAAADATDDGELETDNMDMSTATAIYISFWYMDDDVDAADNWYLNFWDGAAYDLILDMNLVTEDTWTYYSYKTTDSQYFDSTFRIQIIATSPDSGEVAFVDDVVIIREVTAVNYMLDIEEQFTSVDYDEDNEELCILMGPYTNAEQIYVQDWDGDSWNNITGLNSLTANSWNNASVTLTSATYTIRFLDGSPTGDTTQSTWQKDCVLLHVWESTGAAYVAALSQSITIAISVTAKAGFLAVFTQSLTYTWNLLTQITFHLVTSVAVTFTCAIDALKIVAPIAYIADLSVSVTATWNLLVRWMATASFTQTLTTSWNTVLSWTTSAVFSQPITTAWATLIKSAFALQNSLSLTFSWIVDVNKAVGAIAHIAELTVSVSTTWNMLLQWVATANLTQAITSTWNLLTQSTFNLNASLSITTSWIIDAIKGTSNVVVLTLSIITQWSLNLLEIRPDIEELVAEGIVVALIIALPVGIAVASMIMMKRREN